MRSATNGRSHSTNPGSRNRQIDIYDIEKNSILLFPIFWCDMSCKCTVICCTIYILYAPPPSTYLSMILSVPLRWVIYVQYRDKWIVITVLHFSNLYSDLYWCKVQKQSFVLYKCVVQACIENQYLLFLKVEELLKDLLAKSELDWQTK